MKKQSDHALVIILQAWAVLSEVGYTHTMIQMTVLHGKKQVPQSTHCQDGAGEEEEKRIFASNTFSYTREASSLARGAVNVFTREHEIHTCR